MRNITRSGILFFSLVLVAFSLKAQNSTCGSKQAIDELRKSSPAYKAQVEALNAFTRKLAKSGKTQALSGPAGLVTIPVVVHMIHKGGAPGTQFNLSDKDVRAIFDNMTAHYNHRNNISRSNVNFDSTGFKFCLATKGPANVDGTGAIVDYPEGAILRYDGSLPATWMNTSDPTGNPANYVANGVKRINQGVKESDLPKVGQWPLDSYYNVYLITAIDSGKSGTGGYAYYPSNFSTDRAIMLTRSVSGATSTLFAHEMGHALNLAHTFEGDSSSLGVGGSKTCPPDTNCLVDGDEVCDTPPHRVEVSCGSYQDNTPNPCTTGDVSPILHNIMSYSNCTNVFSPGQGLRMRAIVDAAAPTTHRKLQATPTNVVNCGCAQPRSEFEVSSTVVCVGQPVNFFDKSEREPTSWTWTFVGASTPNSSAQNPSITYNTPGTYSVSLVAANANGSGTMMTKTSYITVVAPKTLPFNESFESVVNFPPSGWSRTTDIAGSDVMWDLKTGVSANGSGSKSAVLANGDFVYGVGNNELVLPPVDFSTVLDPVINFDVAYQKYYIGATDSLVVYYSTDCGNTYNTSSYQKGYRQPLATSTGTAATHGTNNFVGFVPKNNEWRHETVSLTAAAGFPNVKIKLVRVPVTANKAASDFLYIDNVRVGEDIGTTCGFSASTSFIPILPAGETGTFSLAATDPTCTWTSLACTWIALNPGSGTGSSTVSYTVLANASGTDRNCDVEIEGAIIKFAQKAQGSTSCTYSLQPPSASIPAAGATGTVTLTTDPTCTWALSPNCNFVSVVNGSGTGPATINYVVAANSSSSPRTCKLIVNGVEHAISQAGSSSCSYSLSSSNTNTPSTGSNHTLVVNTGATCTWTATTNCSFVAIVNSSNGQGTGTVSFTTAPNPGPNSRTCTIDVNGAKHTVFQVGTSGASCTFALTPTGTSIPSGGGQASFTVNTDPSCTWVVTPNCSFINVTPTSGVGPGQVTYTVGPNPTSNIRTCNIQVGDKIHGFDQFGNTSNCSYSITPGSGNFAAAGGTGTFTVSTTSGCVWSATASCSFVSIISGQGSDIGQVIFSVSANTGPNARSCNIFVGGKTYTITQAGTTGGGCNYFIQPPSANYSSSGQSGTFTLSTSPTCVWTATSSCNFIAIINTSGTGPATVSYTIAPNTGSTRTCTLTINGAKHVVTQTGLTTCSYAITPSSKNFSNSASNGAFTVSTSSTCTWTAVSSCSFVTVFTTNGTGTGTINYNIDQNNGPARSCTIEVNGQIYSIVQAAAPNCSYTLQPPSRTFPYMGGGSFAGLSTASHCAWSASASCNFVHLSATSGNGATNINYTVDINSGPARSCVITVNGNQHAVFQEAAPPCNYEIFPFTASYTSSGGNGSVDVITGPVCTWTVGGIGCSFVSIGSSGGMGPATVTYTVAVNTTSSPRSCVITVNGRQHVISQDPAPVGCQYSLQPTANTVPRNAGSSQFLVTTDNICPWTAVANCSFVSVKPASGTGAATVTYTFTKNNGPQRSCTIDVNGQTYTLTQEAAPPCSYTVQPPIKNVAAQGATGTFVVNTDSSCTWAVFSGNCPYVTVQNATGTGPATVTYTVAVNNSGLPRTCILDVNGQKHEIRQSDKTVSIASIESENIKLYPNPAAAELFISLPAAIDTKGELAVYDMQGRLIERRSVEANTSQLQLPLAAYADGLYWISYTSGTKATFVERFSVQH